MSKKLNNLEENENLSSLLKQVQEMLSHKSVHSAYKDADDLSKKVREVLADLDANHNNSVTVEVILNNLDNLDKIAISYRGNDITYKELFVKSFEYAKSLKALGFKEGSEIPVCMNNSPEFVYLLLAINLIGAKINSFGEWFNEDYTKFILEHTKSKYVFVTDNLYDSICDKIDSSVISNMVMFSLRDSLKDDINPYEEIDNRFHKFENKVPFYKNNHSLKNDIKIMDYQEFVDFGKKYQESIVYDCGLDDDFTITYTSGTTSPGRPKAVLNANRSYTTLARFKNSDVSGMPSMKNMRVLAHIPTYTHMELSCGIFDTLYQGCTLCLEPFYDKNFYPYSLVINKPNCTYGSVGFNKHLCDLLNFSSEFKSSDFSQLMLAIITGEGCSAGEEKYFNYTSRKHKFGSGKLPYPLAPITYSIGGGTTEFSGSMVTLFKEFQQKLLKPVLFKMPLGLTPLKFNKMEVLNEDGDYCNIGEPGLIVGKSPCIMKGYYYDSELNKDLYVYDKYGYRWFSLGTIGYKSDRFDRIAMKGRPNSYIYTDTGNKIYYYQIEDTIMKDTKNIMSCSMVKVEDNNNEVSYVCHIILQPFKKKSREKVLSSCMERLIKFVPVDILEHLYVRVREEGESFEVAPSGKRNCDSLIEEGITNKCISPLNYTNVSNKYLNTKIGKIKKKLKIRN